MTFYDPATTLIVDTECVENFWSIGFRRKSDGKTLVIEHSARKQATDQQRARIRNLLLSNTIITYNGVGYDMPMIFKMIDGASNAELKQANQRIIEGGMKPWHAREVLGVEVPRDCYLRKDGTKSDGLHHFDLMESSPAPPTKTGGENRKPSLKTLQGRLHGRKMQEVNFGHDRPFTEAEMDETIDYMENDLEATHNVFDALIEPLALRDTFSREYGINLMSKSDAQMGEAIIKKRVEQEIGERVFKVETPAGTTFKFKAPDYLRFDEGSELADIFERAKSTEFMVQSNGKVELPEWLADRLIHLGESVYQMGIGGLHSTEKNRSVHEDHDYTPVDFDVSAYYPTLIINSGLYPKACGPSFIPAARKMRDERVAAKDRVKVIDEILKGGGDIDVAALNAERARMKAIDAGLKIALNSALFGKTGSRWSVLYAPHLMITTTLTGQFALLMLIQRAEKMGISIVSANTDGVVMRIPRGMMGPVVKDRVTEGAVRELIEQWEQDTGFAMEATPYRSIYNQSVNSYIAVKPDGTVKCKGVVANPWRKGDGFKPDLRGQLMKNPQMTILANAVVDLILHGTPVEETIRAGTDIRDFVTVVNVQGGGTWRGEWLGKVVRYYWSHDGEPILRAKAHETTGNHGQVSKTEGCRPMMELREGIPADLDFERYIAAAHEILMDIGYTERPRVVKPLRIYKHSAILHWAIAV